MELTIEQVCEKADTYRAYEKDPAVAVEYTGSSTEDYWYVVLGQPQWREGIRYRLKPKKKLRPYNQKELGGLVGKVLVKISNTIVRKMVVATNPGGVSLGSNLDISGPEILFTIYQHEDGSPCGVEE